MNQCRTLFFATLFGVILFAVPPGFAIVEVGLSDAEAPTVIRDVYVRDGIPFLAIREVLPPLGLSGSWDSGKHLYRISAQGGEILIAPGSRYLRFGRKSITLKQPPRFIDGELRIPEEMVAEVLPRLLDLKINYRNLDTSSAAEEDAPQAAPPLVPSGPLPFLRRIVIDPGHGGEDPGAISPSGDKEKNIVLAIAQRLEKLLKMENDAPVVLTRNADYAVPLTRRLVEGSGHPDENLLISLHASAWHSSEAKGCTLYITPLRTGESEADDLDLLLAHAMASALQREGSGECMIERAALLPLTASAVPSILVELGYITNPEELRRMRSDDGQQHIAHALALGVRDYAATMQRRNPDVPPAQ